MLLRCKAESARGGEIKSARIAVDLSDHASEVTAAQPLFKRKKSVLWSFRLHMDQPVAHIGW